MMVAAALKDQVASIEAGAEVTGLGWLGTTAAFALAGRRSQSHRISRRPKMPCGRKIISRISSNA